MSIKELERYLKETLGGDHSAKIEQWLGMYTVKTSYIQWTTTSFEELKGFLQGIEFGIKIIEDHKEGCGCQLEKH